MTPREPRNPADVRGGDVPRLATSPLFGPLDAVLQTLSSDLSLVRLKGGETLFTAGDPGDALYMVAFGRLRVLVGDGRNGHQVIGEVGRGEAVGEMAVLTGERRSATVCAIRDTDLIKLSKAAFERLIERQPQVMLALTRLIIERHRRLIHASEEARPVAFAVIPCDAGVPVAEVTAGLVRALGARVFSADAERLRERGLSAEQPAAAFEAPELANWLNEQELQHDYLLYTADPRPSAWTRLCVRQADLVLFVGSGGAASQVDPGLIELARRSDTAGGARRELVLLYDSGHGMPRGTAEWLARLPVDTHHHLDPGLPRDYERLARMITGRAIGLVLGGGGARGLAHIGVIRALEEARIPVDLVGGTSIGGIIGGQCASGWDSARILAESRRVLVDGGSLNDYTLPILGLMRGKRYHQMVEKLYGDRLIEDLPLSFFCMSTNLSRSRSVVHRAGLLRRWIAASMAVPGLGSPVFDGRDVLVDGGVLNNLPVDVMRGFGRGPVLASNVSPLVEMCMDREYQDLLSPWRVLLSWLNPFGAPMRVPSIMSVLMRVSSLPQGPSGQAWVGPGPDLLFEIPTQGHRLLDWRAIDSIVETGYRTAAAAIEQWQTPARAASPSAAAPFATPRELASQRAESL